MGQMLESLKQVVQRLVGSRKPETSTNTESHKDPLVSAIAELVLVATTSAHAEHKDIMQDQEVRAELRDSAARVVERVLKNDS